MSLASEYRRQAHFRPWPRIFEALPPLHGKTVLDLGCAVGDQAAELVARGARVIGIDGNEELLREARARGLSDAEFREADLRAPLDVGVAVDGLWCSFAAAYFPDLSTALASWSPALRAGGFAALTEIDDLFGHEPLSAQARSLLEAYAQEALAAGRHDFHMGRKLRPHLERAGFTVSRELTLEDRELSFGGPAAPQAVDAWRARFDRMTLLREFCGGQFERVRDEFLGCLTRADHRSTAKVYCCIAAKDPRESQAKSLK
jgi:SAM-dependent methyltransferase